MARQDEDRTDQRRKTKTDKKASKKAFQKGTRAGEKRKADHNDNQDEWTDFAGK